MAYQKEEKVRDTIFDLISEGYKVQIARFEYRIREEEKTKRQALMSDEEKKKRKRMVG